MKNLFVGGGCSNVGGGSSSIDVEPPILGLKAKDIKPPIID